MPIFDHRLQHKGNMWTWVTCLRSLLFSLYKDIFTASKSHAKLVSKCLIMSAKAVVLGITASNEVKVGKGEVGHTYSNTRSVLDLMLPSGECTNRVLMLHTCNLRKLLKLSTACESYHLDTAGIKSSSTTGVDIMQHMLLSALLYMVTLEIYSTFCFRSP